MRKPFSLANWKMKMEIEQGKQFVNNFIPLVNDVLGKMDVVIFAPFTSIYPLSCETKQTNLQIGAQNIHPGPQETFTGEISAPLAADAGAKWVMLGHSERRRYLYENDESVNQKVLAAVQHGLKPVILVGEPGDQKVEMEAFLNGQLARLFRGVTAEQAATAVIMYEPENAIGADQTMPNDEIERACRHIRSWIAATYNPEISQQMRVIYGGSVTSENSGDVLELPDVDGLGVGRQSRDAQIYATIVRQVAGRKLGIPAQN